MAEAAGEKERYLGYSPREDIRESTKPVPFARFLREADETQTLAILPRGGGYLRKAKIPELPGRGFDAKGGGLLGDPE